MTWSGFGLQPLYASLSQLRMKSVYTFDMGLHAPQRCPARLKCQVVRGSERSEREKGACTRARNSLGRGEELRKEPRKEPREGVGHGIDQDGGGGAAGGGRERDYDSE